jgi:hypothetical protein
MIFENGPKTDACLCYNNSVLEVVDSFNYLGITLLKNGGWYRSHKCLRDRVMFAFHTLFNILYDISLPVKEQLRLFDTLVASVINYGAEVWGHYVANDVEQVHLKFCRYIIGVKKSTIISTVYGELERMPLLIIRKLRILIYWTRMVNDTSSLKYKVYFVLKHDVENRNTYRGQNWAFQVKTILDDLGLSYVLRNQDMGSECYIYFL